MLPIIPPEECVNLITKLFDDFEKNIQNPTYVFPKNNGDALMNMIVTNSKASIFEDKSILTNNELLVSNGKDILFAIKNIASEPFICKIFLEEKEIHSLIVYKNEIEWIFNGIPLSIISLQYQEIRLKFFNLINEPISSINIAVYYACFENEYRIAFVQCPIIGYLDDTNYFLYSTGVGNKYPLIPSIKPNLEKEKFKPIIQFNARLSIVENYRKTQAHKQIQEIKEELLGITWEPSRVIDWCLDEEDKAHIKVHFK
jgi:hypothetical protein